jgi:anthranilate phosphoribosyltransferase
MAAKKVIDFNPVEAELEAAFHPIHPSTKFVQIVRNRVNFKPSVEVAGRLADPPSLLLILGGVLSVSLLMITAVRAIFYLTSRSKI